MVIRAVLFVIMSVGLLGFGTVAWISTHPTAPPKVEAALPPKTVVLVSARTITAGNLLKPEDMTTKEIDTADVPPDALVDTADVRSGLVGSMVRRSIGANDPILPRDVMRPGDHGFLAAVLGPGMRAVTVSVDAVSGTAGLIWPGDRVDLILLQSREDNTLPVGQRVGAATVLSNVRVIAIDQHLVRGVAPDAPKSNNQDGRTATLEVNPEQAERVSVAAHIGKLSLTVRAAEPAPGDKGVADAPKTNNSGSAVTWASDVAPTLNPGKKPAETTVVHVYQGADKDGKGEEFKF